MMSSITRRDARIVIARLGVVACVGVACLVGAGRLDDAVAIFDFRADASAAASFRERTYPEHPWVAGSAKVLDDARLWIPEDAEYRVVEGRELAISESSGYGRHFLRTLLLPRVQTDLRLRAVGPLLRVYGGNARAGVRGALRVGGRLPPATAAFMTVRAIAGLLVYNLFLLGVGAAVLWGVRGWRWWTELVRLAGVAYLLGVASLMIVLTLELVLGLPIGAWTILLSGALLVVAGLVAGRVRRHAAPGLRPPGWRFPALTLFGAGFVAGIVVYFEALLRADRLSGITREWDSWAFWMPKAQSLYFFDRLEADFLEQLPQLASYPPGMAFIQSGAFHAMGSADTASLHVQYWFLAAGFVGAVIGLLATRVHEAILFPVLLLFLVSPSLLERVTTLYADVPLGYLIAVAALLVLLWILDRETWQLAAATILLAGAMLTKREGLLFAACVLLAAFVATWREWRTLWKLVAVCGVVAFALTAPWRIWFTAEGLESDGPDAGYVGAFGYLERVRPSFELAVETLFASDLWRVGPYRRRRRRSSSRPLRAPGGCRFLPRRSSGSRSPAERGRSGPTRHSRSRETSPRTRSRGSRGRRSSSWQC